MVVISFVYRGREVAHSSTIHLPHAQSRNSIQERNFKKITNRSRNQYNFRAVPPLDITETMIK